MRGVWPALHFHVMVSCDHVMDGRGRSAFMLTKLDDQSMFCLMSHVIEKCKNITSLFVSALFAKMYRWIEEKTPDWLLDTLLLN